MKRWRDRMTVLRRRRFWNWAGGRICVEVEVRSLVCFQENMETLLAKTSVYTFQWWATTIWLRSNVMNILRHFHDIKTPNANSFHVCGIDQRFVSQCELIQPGNNFCSTYSPFRGLVTPRLHARFLSMHLVINL